MGIHRWMNWFLEVFMKFSIFFAMPLFIEIMFLEWTIGGVYLMLTLTVGASKGIRTRLAFLCFKSGRVDFVICFAVPHKFSVVNGLIQAIAFDAFHPLSSTNTGSVSPFPAVFALEDAWIHVSTTHGSDEPSNVKSLVNEGFGLRATLRISYIDLYDGYVGFQKDLYNSWFWG